MSSASWPKTREAFDQAAAWFVSTAAKGRGRWEETALDEWTVRDLVGHTSRALLTVETYLGKPVAAVEVTSPVDYFRLSLASVGDPAAVAQRGRDAGTVLGDEVPQAIGAIADRVRARVRAASEDDLVATPVGGMRLGRLLADAHLRAHLRPRHRPG